MTGGRAIPERRFCPECGTRLGDATGGRAACGECGYIDYRNPVVGVAVVVRDGAGRVLLGRRAHGQYAGLWCIPCGYVEWGEDVRDAAVREMREETGIDVKTGAVVAVHSNFHNPKLLTVGIWFDAVEVRGEPRPVDGEFTELAYFEPGRPPELAFPTDGLVLRDLAASRMPAEG